MPYGEGGNMGVSGRTCLMVHESGDAFLNLVFASASFDKTSNNLFGSADQRNSRGGDGARYSRMITLSATDALSQTNSLRCWAASRPLP
jgi:hypothetical protein